MENYSIFDLMSEDEAEKFKPEEPKRPQLSGVLASQAQHNQEKGLQGEYGKGWEEAMGKDENPVNLNPTASKPTSTPQKKNVKVEQTAEYLSYRKMFCYAGKQHMIEDPTLSMEAIRKRFEKVYPELSKERTEMCYQAPVIPKSKKSKTEESDNNLSFELDKDSDVEDNVEELGEESKTEETTTDTESKETSVKLLPAVVNGQELIGLVIPILKGAKKGSGEELEKTFTSWEELIKNRTVRNLLVAQDGLYEVRIEKPALFCAKVHEQVNPKGESAFEGFELYVPKIPFQLLQQALDLFIELGIRQDPVEALVRFYFDGEKYFLWVPQQVVTHTGVDTIDNEHDKAVDQQNIRVLEMHSHNTMGAFFSEIDNADEVTTGFYAVVGNTHHRIPDIKMRFSCGGHYREINYMDVFEVPFNTLLISPTEKSVLEQWSDKIQIREEEKNGFDWTAFI